MRYTILDCYTDEASGLGVPPYLGTYPRYIYGKLKSQGNSVDYVTIDDFRLHFYYNDEIKEVTEKDKTNIRIYNRIMPIKKILDNTDTLIIILGVHVPGKYLSAVPGTLYEILPYLKRIKCEKILTGPAIFGSQLQGGRYSEKLPENIKIKEFGFEFGNFDNLQKYAVKGSEIISKINDLRIIEIETSRGCNVGKCSFCTEPLKNKFVNRKTSDIIEEIKHFYELGCRYFRLGKQADFYAIEDPVGLLKKINKDFPEIKVLHIDNVNPISVVTDKNNEITKAIVKYCSPGNVAAFGIESFDPEVIKANNLNCNPKIAMKAIEILNKYGQEKGENGLPRFLPGINIIFGLGNESRKTHEVNMNALKEIYDNGWMLRRINIRQAAILPDTKMEKEFGAKFLNKNKKYYWKWRNKIRQEIDFPMLKRILPKNTIIKDIYAEIYDGKTTFGRQIGTYPLIVGIKKRLPLKKFYNVKIKDHMLRSVTGEVISF
jgi:radical SAM superfamily enzyme with C-terminal helix-hairpin-helix motif